ncbi:hypothetical protein DQ244_02635 [Blastococcus sp. TBT05-19]|nr:hypothetical protein DQ244_02635 [Blastococcus sp. TBT05-19]
MRSAHPWSATQQHGGDGTADGRVDTVDMARHQGEGEQPNRRGVGARLPRAPSLATHGLVSGVVNLPWLLSLGWTGFVIGWAVTLTAVLLIRTFFVGRWRRDGEAADAQP